MKAALTNKRKQPNRNGAYTVTATCPGCGNARTVAWAGWSTIVCGGCGAELKRGKYRSAADVRMDGLEDRIVDLERRMYYALTALEEHQIEY